MSISFYFRVSLLAWILTLFACLSGQEDNTLFKDLMIVDYWNKKQNDRLPVFYDHSLQGGYIAMPSARMGRAGELGLGYAYAPPYYQYNLRCQLFSHFEVTGNYRIFKGVDDPILSPLGFGDLSDKGANLKFAFVLPEDSQYRLPGVAIGYSDFIGTQNFKAKYIVLTQVFRDYNLELSVGFGKHRIKGWFGGLHWIPFHSSSWTYLQGLCFAAEYDATPYRDAAIERHPKGRVKKSPFNIGLKYRLWDHFDCSLSYIRGDALAVSASCFYNLGCFEGILPKIDNCLPYTAPADTEPLGLLRPTDMLAQELAFAFERQGFGVLCIQLGYDDTMQKILRLRIENLTYRDQCAEQEQFNALMLRLIPDDIDQVIICVESEGLPIQEYLYRMEYVRMHASEEISIYELDVITKIREVTYPDACCFGELLACHREAWNLEVYPKTLSFFGSSRGKFKYALGLHVALNGFLFGDIYYSLLVGKIFWTNMHHLTGVDRLNPSQLINVRTDIVEYYKQRGITLDEAYLQKNWNLGKGWFSKLALGIFEEEYGGVAGQLLFYPLGSNLAIGAEGAWFKKRTYKGVGFTNKARKLKGFIPTWHAFYGKQVFLDLYTTFPECEMDVKLMVGKFLANDYGARLEVARYFSSGLKITIWYTRTNANDKINGQTYHDKGIAFTMPLDIFYTYSERSHFGYGMSAWLRDSGVIACTGMDLYNIVHDQRK